MPTSIPVAASPILSAIPLTVLNPYFQESNPGIVSLYGLSLSQYPESGASHPIQVSSAFAITINPPVSHNPNRQVCILRTPRFDLARELFDLYFRDELPRDDDEAEEAGCHV